VRASSGLGVYVPVASPVHALDARVKMLLTAAFTVVLFVVDGFGGLLAAAVLVALVLWLSRVPFRVAARGLRAIALLLAFTLLANAVRFDLAAPLVHLGRVGVDAAGLQRGLFFATRIVLLVLGTSLLTLTTSPVELTDALERLMRPLRVVRVPVGDIAMMLSVALRFIPTTAEEAERVITAQQARGARFDVGGPVRRAHAYVPVLVPLFVQLFRRADELATAMEARCYRGGEGRTRLRVSTMRAADWATLLCGTLVLVLLAVGL
jgi:energy-coupling factor transport system permease protein